MNENILKDIGANIILHRKMNGMTQVACASKARIGVALLSKIERGIAGDAVPLVTYIKIAESLRIPLGDLLKTTDVRIKTLCVRKSVK